MKESLEERTLTKNENKEKERVVKGMKKSYKDFKARYGKDAKSVMYATATKMAKEELEPLDEKCWKGYTQKGMKKKGKKVVPNCVPIGEGLDMKTFKANRKKNERKSATADARKRGHEGSEWHNTGRTYSPDEAKSRRKNMSDDERSVRHGVARDPDSPEGYSADKTKNPKKIRKQKSMGEQKEAAGKKDACYHKVKASASVWPSAYASGRLVQCRKKGADNYGKSTKKESYVLKPFSSFLEEGAAWTKKEGQNSSGGLNEKGRKSYERGNPGSDLKAPSKKVGNPRRASFCARMKGMRKRQKDSNNTGEDRLSKSLRAWNC
jgi:hypothetical protein